MNPDDPLNSLHSGTKADLDALLNVEAGLREVLVAAQHSRTGDALDLDIEAGLRAIVPAPEAHEPFQISPPLTHTGQPSSPPSRSELQGAVADRLMMQNSATRLTLRNHPAVAALTLILEITNAAITNQTLPRIRDRSLALARTRERDRALDRARAYALVLAGDLDQVFAGVRALTLTLARDLDRDRVVDAARTLELTLDRARGLARSLARNSVLEGDLDLDLGVARALTDADGHSRALDRDVARARSLGLSLDLDHARHDFMGADLSGVDLSMVSLIGIRWSMATRWPSDEWRAQALLDSRDLGDGTYEIRDGTTNVPSHRI